MYAIQKQRAAALDGLAVVRDILEEFDGRDMALTHEIATHGLAGSVNHTRDPGIKTARALGNIRGGLQTLNFAKPAPPGRLFLGCLLILMKLLINLGVNAA